MFDPNQETLRVGPGAEGWPEIESDPNRDVWDHLEMIKRDFDEAATDMEKGTEQSRAVWSRMAKVATALGRNLPRAVCEEKFGAGSHSQELLLRQLESIAREDIDGDKQAANDRFMTLLNSVKLDYLCSKE